jgi:hypothetical protein
MMWLLSAPVLTTAAIVLLSGMMAALPDRAGAGSPTPGTTRTPILSDRDRAVALAAALPQASHDWIAEWRATTYFATIFGLAPLARARVELLASDAGWMVIFRGARATCGGSNRRIGPCN